MIDPKELRVGNLVLLDGKHTATVTAIAGDNITTKNPHNKYVDGSSGDVWDAKNDFIEPIPITAEWLEIAGFKNEPADSLCYEGAFPLYNYNEDGVYYYNHSAGALKILYIHQLQNLFFALCGEELTVKEK